MSTIYSSHSDPISNDLSDQTIRQRLSKLLQLHGYSACREALILLEDHFTSSNKYESPDDFVSKVNQTVTFETHDGTSVIDSNLAYVIVNKLERKHTDVEVGQEVPQPPPIEIPTDLNIRVKNSEIDSKSSGSEFNIHYNFLFKRLNTLPVFSGDFQLTRLSTLTASNQTSIRCVCFGLLIKDLSKIDTYTLIDSTGRVPVRISPDTVFRNRLVYTNCIFLVEGVYVNPDDILYAANIGLPPVLLDPIVDKALSCIDEKLVVSLKDLYLDDDDTVQALQMLFDGYDSMQCPPALFILIGDFTRNPCDDKSFRGHMKKLIRILKSCENLTGSYFVFVPGLRDTATRTDPEPLDHNALVANKSSSTISIPRRPLNDIQFPMNSLRSNGFAHIYEATNPCHIFLGDRQISVVAHSYVKALRSNLIHDLSDHRHELYETIKQIVLSNAHLSAGLTKTYHSSTNLWHKPDLLLLADSEAFGNRYDYSHSSRYDTSFATVPSFTRQSFQFKVYNLKTGEIDDSQVSSDALRELEVEEIE